MPFLKFSRDKRGYEHFSIVEPSAPRRGKSSRPRVLFWFRTPPQVKVGREPFTDEVRRAIEAQNPGLKFDWVRLMATPIPAADAEHWRERRRAEKAARLASRESGDTDQGAQDGQDIQVGRAGQVGREHEGHEEHDEHDEHVGTVADDAIDDDSDQHDPAEPVVAASTSQEPASALAEVPGGDAPAGVVRRRRRRGRRRRHQTAEAPPAGAEPTAEPAVPNVPVPPTEEV